VRQLDAWTWHPIREMGWVMSIVARDMDGDGDSDLVISDRRGARRGCFWLDNPGAERIAREPGLRWREHPIGAVGREVMFVSIADLDGDGLDDVVAAVKPRDLVCLRRHDKLGRKWSSRTVEMPAGTGGAKGVGIGDIDLDGRADLVFTCEGANGPLSGVRWMRASGPLEDARTEWTDHEIGGAPGTKFDRIELLDLDADGDLDVLTCEEWDGLGVIWYENPARAKAPPREERKTR